MKTFYLKTTMKLLRTLPALIFFILALSYTARSQFAFPNPVCYGQPINLVCSLSGCGVPGATYTWTNVSGSWTSNEENPIIMPGTTGYATDRFYLSVQFAPPPGGFSGGSILVTVLSNITVTGTTTNIQCFGQNTGAVNITASGGRLPYKYLWSNGATTRNISNLTAGDYTVSVTDFYNCPVVAGTTFTVAGPSSQLLIANAAITDVACAGEQNGAIDLTITGGTTPYSFIWSTTETTEDISNLAGGTYSVTVTDFYNCAVTGSWVVNEPSNITWVGSVQNVSCFGGNNGFIQGSTSGGTPPYTYIWSNGATDENIYNLTAGIYGLTVTDANGCDAFTWREVLEPTELLVDPTAIINNVSCFDGTNGSIDITVSGGTLPYSFLWNNGAMTEDISGLAAGTYTVVVTDGNNCTATGSWTITQPDLLTVTGSATPVLCFGGSTGSIDISVSGGTMPYGFVWSNGENTEDISNLLAGTYNVVITDANGCSATGSWTVTEPDALSLSGIPVPVLCNGGNTGSIDITVGGGVMPYSYLWDNGATSEDLTGLAAGTYGVVVTDANNCTISNSWIVTEPAALGLSASATNVSCFGGSNGAIDLTVSGGTAPFFYLWSNGEVTEDLSGLIAGTYGVTVTDFNGCVISDSWTITEPTEVIITGSAFDVTCNGGADGSIDITVTGGVMPYTYSWSNGATSEDISGLSAGVYTVIVLDDNECEKTASFTVGEPTALDATAVVTDVNCNGENNGAIDLSVTGGTTPYGFVWSTGETTEDIASLFAGTYTVTITDAHNCVLVESWMVNEPSNVSWFGSVQNVSCFGGNDGFIQGTTLGGTPPYTYLWSNGATDENIYNLTAGIYYLTVTDSHGCNAFTFREVLQPTELVVDPVAVVTNVSCYGGSNGAIDITVTGGTMPYSYLWNNGATSEDLSGLAAGTYTVVVTDAHQCTATGTWTVTQPDMLVVTGIATPVLCNGGNTGSIDITVVGGVSPYTFLWNTGEVTEDISGLTAGTYYVMVTDANGCTSGGSWTVTEPEALALSGMATPVLCNGGNTGSIDITVGGGTMPYSYLWSNGATSEDISGLTAGTYGVVVTDANNCTISDSFTVTEPDALALTASVVNATCFGYANGSIDLTVSGGTYPFTYAWSNGAYTEDINALAAGTYTVTVTDFNGCVITDSYVVTEPTEVVVSGIVTDVTCNGGADGAIDITVTGGTMPYSYYWSNGQSSEDLSGLTAGTYTVYVSDANQCSAMGTFTVNEPTALDATAVITDVNCNGENNGAIDLTVTGGTTPYAFEWSTGETTEDIASLFAGTYTVTITDAHNCELVESWIVNEPSNVSWFGSVQNVSCFGGNDGYIQGTTLGGTPPYTYQWSSGQTTENIYNLSAGLYYLTVTDAHGCNAFTFREVLQPTELVVDPVAVVTNVSCYDGSNGAIDITVTGGTMPYSYLWNNGATSEDISGLDAGTYTVVVTDAHQCTATGSWTVTQPDMLTVTGVATPVLCNGGNTGSIDITVAGGVSPYTFLWSNGEVTEDISNLIAGTYYVMITDANGCTAGGSWTVTEPEALVVEGTPTPVLCNGGNTGSIDITVAGGVMPYGYLWNNGATTEDISGLTAGTYTVVITDANNCTTSGNWTVTEPTALALSATVNNATCFGRANGSIDLTVTGGTPDYTYLWSNGATNEDISGLAAGTYTVTVTDENGCTISDSWSIGEPIQIAITGIVTNVSCNDGSDGAIDITVTGGTMPYFYSWSNGETSEDLTGLSAGTYTVYVSDANQCSAMETFTVGQPDALEATAVVTGVNCNGENNGAIDLTVTGGTTPYAFEWSTGETTEDISMLFAGTYTVTITDAHNCLLVDSWVVDEPSNVSWFGSVQNVSCFGGNDGFIQGTTLGGTPPYTYQWSSGQTTENIYNLSAGIYYLTVTDAHGCNAFTFREVLQPALLVVDPAAVITNVSCYGGSDGAIDITVTGGTMPYSYLWNNGATSEDISGLAIGTYTVLVTDAHQCTATGSWTITQPDAIALTAVVTPVACAGGNDGAIDLTVTGGTAPFTYLWSTGAMTEDINGLSAGLYSVVVTDANGCSASGYWYVTEPMPIYVSGIASPVSCYGGNNGSIDITVSGGSMPYIYLWSNGAITEDISGLTAGVYTVTVTDNHGCSFTDSWTVAQPEDITITGVVTPVNCFGGSDGAIDITVVGGTMAYSYLWSNGATSEDLFGIAAGTYTVTVTDANQCVKSETFVVDQPAQILLSATTVNVSCFEGNNGSIDLSVLGGNAPYSYIWSNGETTEDLNNLVAGTYDVTVTDATDCYATGSWTITEPTALELGATVTSATCYTYTNGGIDLTVNGGTPAYAYAWSNGATTQDLSNIGAGWYTVVVTDANNCTATGSWYVSEPPMWTIGIIGPQEVCCSTSTTNTTAIYTATISGTYAPPVTYQWVIEGGTIISGQNSPTIEVLWSCCGTGKVWLTVNQGTPPCALTTFIPVTIISTPAPVITGPVTITANDVSTYCTPFVAGHLYTWSVVGGTIISGQGTNCITVQWGDYPPCGCGEVTVCESTVMSNGMPGCTGCTTQAITILPNTSGINLSGTVSYKNGLPNTPLNGVTLNLRDLATNNIVATTVTGPNMNPPLYTGDPGYYAFMNVPAGNYRIEASFNGAWGGNNATDALLIQLEAGAAVPCTYICGLFREVADVNASMSVTGLDALYVKLRTVGSISSYPAGDWKFENPVVTIPVAGPVDFAGLCYGDVNGSYIPTGLKAVSFVSTVDEGTEIVPVEETFSYEIKSNTTAELGAMTLFMGYDADRFEVIDVTTSSSDEMKYVIEEGNVSIAWANTNPMVVRNDDQIFTLTVKAKAPITEPAQIFSVNAGSEFADPRGTRYDNFDLKMSKVITPNGANEFSMFNYPNPFKSNTTIAYTMPEAGKVTLVITDMFGKTLRTLVDENQAAGTHTVSVTASDLGLTSGVYLYRIEVAGETDSFVKVNKMVFAK